MESSGFLVDASVALKWFISKDEEGLELARDLIGRVPLKTTSLAIYEIGSRLARSRENDAGRVSDALNQVHAITGDPVGLIPADFKRCAEITKEHGVTFYDASYVAIAERLGRVVVSADRDLVDPGLAVGLETATRDLPGPS